MELGDREKHIVKEKRVQFKSSFTLPLTNPHHLGQKPSPWTSLSPAIRQSDDFYSREQIGRFSYNIFVIITIGGINIDFISS